MSGEMAEVIVVEILSSLGRLFRIKLCFLIQNNLQ